MVTHSSALAWEIPWTEEPGGLQSTGSQWVRCDLATKQKQQYWHIEKKQCKRCISIFHSIFLFFLFFSAYKLTFPLSPSTHISLLLHRKIMWITWKESSHMSSGMYTLIHYISYDPLWVIQTCGMQVWSVCEWLLVFSKMGYTQRFSYSAILHRISSKSFDAPLIFFSF